MKGDVRITVKADTRRIVAALRRVSYTLSRMRGMSPMQALGVAYGPRDIVQLPVGYDVADIDPNSPHFHWQGKSPDGVDGWVRETEADAIAVAYAHHHRLRWQEVRCR